MNGLTTETLASTNIMGSGPAEQFLRRPVTVKSGQTLAAGTVVGKVTADGKYIAYANGNADGSEVARAIVEDAVDASAGDVVASAFVRGNFITSALTGMDANALTDFGARVFEGETLI